MSEQHELRLQEQLLLNCNALLDAVHRSKISAGASGQDVDSGCQGAVDALKRVISDQATLRQRLRNSSSDADGVIQNLLSGRAVVLDDLIHQLDGAAQRLSDTLVDIAAQTPASGTNIPKPHEVIQYAHKLRYTTFAHMGLVNAPPAPQPQQMVQSQLYRFAHEHQARVGGPAHAAMPPPPAPPADTTAAYPPGFQLPSDLPQPPAGWKPGDPVGIDRPPQPVEAPAAQPETIDRNMAQMMLNPDLYDFDEDDESDEDEGEDEGY